MEVITVLRDTADEHIDLVKMAPEDNGYILRQWRYPVGVKLCIVTEIKLEEHEVLHLLEVMLDEVEKWRKRESA